jgi:hypothetical protein
LQAAAGVIGGPTVLGQGSSQQQAFNRGQTQATSSGSGSGGSSGFTLGIGSK